ncbi:hypothetical protein BBR47_16170 [Brevibacillus brevis NBRC 100599]|uniref:Uncharacterized protein n=1 Tax=Brevibacillus brevis (strain 47 / JCM 6285 / NBRC 100599) TaxID=358681 RepID=C0Z9C4_BREBN|nr:hypothetical protein BBR47_16170 [Brevibacillus brevis NBRC 100599]
MLSGLAYYLQSKFQQNGSEVSNATYPIPVSQHQGSL